MDTAERVRNAELRLERDVFLRQLVRELSGSLQDVVGIAEASGYISIVGQAIGEQINDQYCSALSLERLSRADVAQVLVDLKRRIQGDFYIIEENEDRIVLGNRACPFGEFVAGRPAPCMMTSNVFGHIAAENLGYARIEIDQAIARGDSQCRVTVHLRPQEDATGREYFRRDHG
jgi:predicted ArsR family transcriptional regulator